MLPSSSAPLKEKIAALVPAPAPAPKPKVEYPPEVKAYLEKVKANPKYGQITGGSIRNHFR